MLKDIKELSWNHYVFVTLGFFGAMCPGFLTIYLFKPDILITLDTIKLIIFSLALTMPVFIVNIILCNTSPLVEDDNKTLEAFVALFLSAVVLYPVIIISYLFGFSFKAHLSIVAVLQILLGLAMLLSGKRSA